MKCPKCNSEDVEIIDEEMGFIKCNKCGFNEIEDYDAGTDEEERETQREKNRYSPYRQSGGRR
jgi:Zn ribbon nucleic-acid-binding protein